MMKLSGIAGVLTLAAVALIGGAAVGQARPQTSD